MSNQTPNYPAIYTEEDLQRCNQALQNCAINRDIIERLKRIGLDMSHHENENSMHHDTLMRWKKEFFPHLP